MTLGGAVARRGRAARPRGAIWHPPMVYLSARVNRHLLFASIRAVFRGDAWNPEREEPVYALLLSMTIALACASTWA